MQNQCNLNGGELEENEQNLKKKKAQNMNISSEPEERLSIL